MKESLRRLLVHDLPLIMGLCFIVWGMVQWDSGTFQKDADTSGPQPVITTLEAPAGSVMVAHVVAKGPAVELRIVKMNERVMSVRNDTPGQVLDTFVAAHGTTSGGEVTLWAMPSRSRTSYAVFVVPVDTTLLDTDLEYTVDYTLWKPDYSLLMFGTVVVFLILLVPHLIGRRVMSAVGEPGVGASDADRGFSGGRQQPGPAPPEMRGGRAPARGPAPARAPVTAQPPPAMDDYPPPGGYDYGAPPEGDYGMDAGQEAAMPPARAPPPMQRAPPPRAAAPPRPVARIRCSACGTINPVFTRDRPVKIVCANCGRSGVLR